MTPEDRENRKDVNAGALTKERPADDEQAQLEAETDELQPLFDEQAAEKFRTRWMNIQSRFVEDPRVSVQEADALVTDLLRSIATSFDEKRSGLERQWHNGTTVSTEDLRLTLQRYRSFFDHMLRVQS